MPSAYLDHAASTPMRPEALSAMTAVLAEVDGNPSGAHGWARTARRRLDDARDQVATYLGVEPREVVFTSGGTEADNLAVAGSAEATGGTVLCSAIEHHAVLEPVLARGGQTVPVNAAGVVTPDVLREALEADRSVSLVSIMAANNEVGTCTDLGAFAGVVAEARPHHHLGLVLHTDAVAAAAWVDLSTEAAGVDLISVSGHKVGGPKGIGALAVRGGTPLAPRVLGGGQEHDRRSGTPNVAGAVGLGVALEVAAADRAERRTRVGAQRDRLREGLLAQCAGLRATVTAGSSQLPNIVHLCAEGVSGEALVFLLDQAAVAASAGASCASGAVQASHVTSAMGVEPGWAAGAFRLSLGWNTTDAEIDHALSVVPVALAQLRQGSASRQVMS